MDLLTDLLHQAGRQRRVLNLRHITPDDALQFPCERSMGMHLVRQGQLYLHAPSLPQPLLLQAGDVALMARGCVHVLSNRADLQGLVPRPIGVHPLGSAPPDDEAPGASAGPSVISGAYQFWNTPLHPFFTELPAWFVLRADTLPRLGPLALAMGLLDDEVRQHGLGSTLAVQGLMDLVYTLLLREVLARQDSTTTASWGQAVRDPQVRRVVDLMHADPARPWALDDLARAAGLSRTALAERFRSTMGDTPLAYLRTVRMQKAMQLLSETDARLEDLATQVGYTDAFSFSKVFKRAVGMAPKEFRRRDASEKTMPWRFAG